MKPTTYSGLFVCALATLAVLISAGCASTIETFVDYDEQADFAAYETFSWIGEHPLVTAPRLAQATNPFLEGRIQDAVSAELRARGYRFEAIGNEVDFVVSFSVAARHEMSVESYPSAYRGRWRWGGAYLGDSVSVESTTEGMLSIDVFDGKTKSPVWHGRAQKNLTSADEKLRSSIITDAVAEVLKDFPPTAY